MIVLVYPWTHAQLHMQLGIIEYTFELSLHARFWDEPRPASIPVFDLNVIKEFVYNAN